MKNYAIVAAKKGRKNTINFKKARGQPTSSTRITAKKTPPWQSKKKKKNHRCEKKNLRLITAKKPMKKIEKKTRNNGH